MGLLGDGDGPVLRIENEAGTSPFLLTADHAGRAIPRRLGTLGLTQGDLDRHIAWDIGIAEVTARLAHELDAVALMQNYSRLVIDCNRRPDVASAYPLVSEATMIPGNAALTEAEKQERRQEIFEPYHIEIKRMIGRRGARKTIYVAMHSFTPVYLGKRRLMDVALLYNRNPALSAALVGLLRAEPGLTVGENEPYRVSDETDYGVPVHAENGGLDYVEIEIRQDLISADGGQADWAARLARLLPMAMSAMLPVTT